MITITTVFASMLFLFSISAYTLHKVRNIHLMTYQLRDRFDEDYQHSVSLFRQFQAYHSLEKKLKLPSELPPLRGWAASPDFLLVIANHVFDSDIECVVECSSGASTVTLARCLQLKGKGHVYSLENDEVFAEKTRSELRKNNLDDWATVLTTPLHPVTNSSQWYDLTNVTEIEKIDMLVIDGPPSFINEHARYPALPQLQSYFSNTTVFLDDANRSQEKAIIEKWKEEFDLAEINRHDCEKGCVSFKI